MIRAYRAGEDYIALADVQEINRSSARNIVSRAMKQNDPEDVRGKILPLGSWRWHNLLQESFTSTNQASISGPKELAGERESESGPSESSMDNVEKA